MITGMHHVCLKAKGEEDFKKLVSFYKDVLGLPVRREWNGGAMLSAGETVMELMSNADDERGAGVIRHFAFRATEIEKIVENCEKAGYKIKVPPTDISIPSNPALNAKIAFVIGPLGEEIELFDEK